MANENYPGEYSDNITRRDNLKNLSKSENLEMMLDNIGFEFG